MLFGWRRFRRGETIAARPAKGKRRAAMMLRVIRPLLPFLLVALFLTGTPRAWAQDTDSSIWLRALLDVRVVRGGSAPSWTDSGPGKTRYGGSATAGGFERSTRFELSQLAIQLGAALPWEIRARAQMNVERDLAGNYDPYLIEALLRKEWGKNESGWGVQTGLMNSPFSLEHVGPAWSPEYSISASALDSWLWEEISLAGIEAETWRVTQSRLRLDGLVGAGFGPDLLGRLVSLRGWAMGDGLSGINTRLSLPSGVRTEIFRERDHRPAAYALVSVGDADERAAVRLGYFDNFGDQNVDGAWHTRFSTVGAILHPAARVDVIAQYLKGAARVLATTNDSDLCAFYGLVSYHQMRHRLTLRYDTFRVLDVDGGHSTQEAGHAWTFAYLLELGLRHRIGLEYVGMDSHRAAAILPEPSQDGWQLSYRFRY